MYIAKRMKDNYSDSSEEERNDDYVQRSNDISNSYQSRRISIDQKLQNDNESSKYREVPKKHETNVIKKRKNPMENDEIHMSKNIIENNKEGNSRVNHTHYDSEEEYEEEPDMISPYDVECTEYSLGDKMEKYKRIPSIKPTKHLYPIINTDDRNRIGGLKEDVIDDIIEFQEEIDTRRDNLESSPLYEFVRSVAGNMNTSESTYLEKTVGLPIGSLIRNREEWRNKNNSIKVDEMRIDSMKKLSSLIDSPIGNGTLRVTAPFQSAVNNSLTDLRQWARGRYRNSTYDDFQLIPGYNPRKRIPDLEEMINNPSDVTTRFAELVALNLCLAEAKKGRVTQLKKTTAELSARKDLLIRNILSNIF